MSADTFAFLWDMTVFALAAGISIGVLLSDPGTPPDDEA